MGTRDREPTDREREELTRDVCELAKKWERILAVPSSRPAGERVDLVRALGALTRVIDSETARCVADAREAGAGDRRLGSAWGISKQGAAKKWPRPRSSATPQAIVHVPTLPVMAVEVLGAERRADPVARSTEAIVRVPEEAAALDPGSLEPPDPPLMATPVAPASDREPASPRLRIGRRRADGSQHVTYGGIDIGTTMVSRYGTGYIATPAGGGPALEDERIYGAPRPAAAALLTHAHGTPSFRAALKAFEV